MISSTGIVTRIKFVVRLENCSYYIYLLAELSGCRFESVLYATFMCTLLNGERKHQRKPACAQKAHGFERTSDTNSSMKISLSNLMVSIMVYFYLNTINTTM